ncbi:hypothetical protein LB566_06175 [Mesorhizobium sp. CA13]|uniref:hypothetical protein n=1 Tax=Mesorhizobium sp. CA13 TaxID=2876643 RepID=UPI001CCFA96A|nr:hypothetical protein [Mesorhizobium sp. CA13]MBZ9853377.1 hypothetical protein [Mesorhizobium sp. CA13]
MVSAVCLARRTVPSVSAIVRLSASSLLMVSRADLTIIGLPVRPMATAYAVAGLMGGLIAVVLPLELLAETMVLSLFGENKRKFRE